MDELGPIVTHLPLDSPGRVAKQKLGVAGKNHGQILGKALGTLIWII